MTAAASPSIVTESTAPIPLAVITASTRHNRFGPTVTEWVVEQARAHGEFRPAVLDLAEVPLSPDLTPTAGSEQLGRSIDAAEAIVIVTCEYNHGYPASIKHALDTLRTEWQAKPVAFVSYGGLSGGLRAVEQLRQVTAELHMVSIRETVSFHLAHERFDDHGVPRDTQANAAAEVLLTQLAWWAHALTAARSGAPYPA